MSNTARVVIVGAGLAGLAAAATLFQSGFKRVLILEAQDKPGGRINTVRPFGPDIVELGANWIHGQVGNPLYALALERGLLHHDAGASAMCLPASVTPADYFFREGGQQLDPNVVEQVCLLFGQLTARAFEGMLDDQYLHGSLGSYLDKAFAAETTSTSEMQEIYEWCKRMECTDEASSTLYEVSASQICHYTALRGGFFNTLGPKGYGALLNVLQENVPEKTLMCNTPVKCIQWSRDKGKEISPVLVVCQDGQEYEADHVIVSTSLGVLKECIHTMFTPPLPEPKASAILRLGFGTVDKIFLQFSERFWPDDCAGIQLVWKEGHEEEITHCQPPHNSARGNTWYKKICGFDVVLHHPTVLCGWITGREAEYMETLSEQEVGDTCVRLLKSFTPWSVPELTHVLVSKWHRNPYVQGSYTFVPCGVDAVQEHTALAQPLPSDTSCSELKPFQLLFAGEATHLNFYTTTHGAYISGVREAERLINLYASTEVTECNARL